MARTKISLLVGLFISFGLAGLVFSADETNLNVKWYLDWSQGSLELELKTSLPLTESPFGRARLEAERSVEGQLTNIFLEAAKSIVLNSTQTLAEFINEETPFADPQLYLEEIALLTRKVRKRDSIVSADFRSLTVTYSLAFWGENGFVTPLILHRQVQPLPRMIGYFPTKKFTGLVIYAQGRYPAFGKSTRVTLTPSLFPRLFYLNKDGALQLLLEKQMLRPDSLKRWGMVAFITSAERQAYRFRAGDFPLEVSNQFIYGIKNTDLVLSEDVAAKLLSSEENAEILRTGRIVVIID